MYRLFKPFDLPHYYAVLEGRQEPFYLSSKKTKVPLIDENSVSFLEKLAIIEQASISLIKGNVNQGKSDKSLFSLKIEMVNRMLKTCIFCEKRCKVDRRKTKGLCGVSFEPKISSIFLHYGEEEELVPSLTVFYSGCNFNCLYCQNYEIARFPEEGKYYSPSILASLIEEYEKQGAKNVNFVGGDPTPSSHHIFAVLSEGNFKIPVVWNSNMYMSSELQSLLIGVVDLYLADFRYGNDDCAQRLSNISNYTEIVKRNLNIAFDTADVIVRHLVLPNHLECCTKKVLMWLEKEHPDVNLNVMFQYHPCGEAFFSKELARRLTEDEMKKVLDMVLNSNLKNARVG
ncbi:MAG: radical SAM protein [Actinobacteria bacterium]|nr:radical SAM protein [Actinomycetota bacterium]